MLVDFINKFIYVNIYRLSMHDLDFPFLIKLY